MWLGTETDVAGSGRKLLRDRKTLPKLRCCLLTACSWLLLHAVPYHGVRNKSTGGIAALSTLCLRFDFIKCPNISVFLHCLKFCIEPYGMTLEKLGAVPLAGGFSTRGLLVTKSHISAALVLIKAGTGLPLGARQSSEGQEAGDPPSFTHAESENKNIARRHVSEGIGKQRPSGLGL